MNMRAHRACIVILALTLRGCLNCASIQSVEENRRAFTLARIQSDTLFDSRQSISILTLPFESLRRYVIVIGYSDSVPVRTSAFAERYHAVAALNGGFFDMKHGGSVTYFELNDSVISRTQRTAPDWSRPDTMMNGAVVLTEDGMFHILPAQADRFYEGSRAEAAVLVTGPLLIHDASPSILPSARFTYDRHPRTCLGKTSNALLFVAIDGRTDSAAGMSLVEAQKFLLRLGCVEAVNLDGGGSTTLWTKEQGIVNHPSDKTGERPVANAVLIIKR
ncbi:MAG: phosphodiester glycosidase family protein [Bacteroidota bacterium]